MINIVLDAVHLSALVMCFQPKGPYSKLHESGYEKFFWYHVLRNINPCSSIIRLSLSTSMCINNGNNTGLPKCNLFGKLSVAVLCYQADLEPAQVP